MTSGEEKKFLSLSTIFSATKQLEEIHHEQYYQAMDSSYSDDDIVILICENHNSIETDFAHKEIFISTAEIKDWDLPTILSYQIIKVQANRGRLIEQSSYFQGLLSGSFSESYLNCISINWNTEVFLNVLKFVYDYSMDITSINFLPLFEAALFFGVETLLLNCKNWVSNITLCKSLLEPKLQLADLIHVWNFSLEHANDFIPELCAGYLARNFMWAMSCNSFCEVPYNLLLCCIKHSHLTVDSEKHLCDALLVWLDANREWPKCPSNTESDWTDLLKQIRISLLPLWYATGNRRHCYFSKLADESTNAILSLIKHISMGSMNNLVDHDFYLLKIRLTEYTKKVDLSGCLQVTLEILLLSMLPSSYVMDPMWRKKMKRHVANLQRLDVDRSPISSELLPTLSFEAVQEVDISMCSWLNLEAVIECFSKSFPLLRILKAAYLLNFEATMLGQLVQKCPKVSEVDLTVDISPVILSQATILSSTSEAMPLRSTKPISTKGYPLATSFFLSGPLLSNITKLTLEGRSDVTDTNLKDISEFCVSIYYLNLKGCISVTDIGISVLIGKCRKLHSIVVCDTTFGRNSVLALCSGIPNYPDDAHLEKKHLDSLAHQLQMLHMGGCNGVDEASLLELMSQTHKLKSLCLRGTNLVDHALYSCLASSLEMLDISNTMVTGAAVAHIIRGNPCLKCLKARDCKKLMQPEIIAEGGDCLYKNLCKELFIDLAKTCKLEEIAFGWGFTYFSLEALKPAITSLKMITVGLGASLGQDALTLLPAACPLLESVILYFQVISDSIMINILNSLRHLQVLALCYCLGDLSSLSFNFGMTKLRTLKLERVTPWMTNDDLVILTQNCTNLTELSLLGCTLLNSDSQQIISRGWPGLISIHLEDCGKVTANGVASLLDCKALTDLLLRHNGPGIQRNFIMDAASVMPMLRKLSLDLCDASEGHFEIPYYDRYSLSIVKIARCKSRKCTLDLQILEARRRPVHKETLVLVWSSTNLNSTVVKERV